MRSAAAPPATRVHRCPRTAYGTQSASSTGGKTAIDEDRLPGDVIGRAACQVERGSSEIAELAVAPDERARCVRLPPCGIGRNGGRERCREKSRRYRVGVDAPA